jgi:opacity protein-like surface antigen
MAVALFCGAAVAQAQEGPHDWRYEVSLYGWAKSIEGTSGDAEIDLDFLDDIVDMLEGVFMASFEAETDLVSLFASYEYSEIGDDARLERDLDFTIPPNGPTVPIKANSKIEANVKEHMAQIGAGYSIGGSGDNDWRILGGFKWFKDDTTIKLRDIKLTGPGGGELPSIEGRKVSEDEDWWQPFLGLRFTTQLGDSWKLRARGDYGYRDSDNTSWLLEALADWRFNDWGALRLGYRYMEIDFDNGSNSHPFVYDVKQYGPIVGLIVHF